MIEFFEGKNGVKSMGRLLAFGGWVVSSLCLIYLTLMADKDTLPSLISVFMVYMPTYAAQYVGGKAVNNIGKKDDNNDN